MYTRVIPRDLFNEAKLLKCLGRLALFIHDELAPVALKVTSTGKPFEIDQDASSGSLYCKSGVTFTLNGERLLLSTPLNSREVYPLLAETEDHPDAVYVFDEAGYFTDDFLMLARTGGRMSRASVGKKSQTEGYIDALRASSPLEGPPVTSPDDTRLKVLETIARRVGFNDPSGSLVDHIDGILNERAELHDEVKRLSRGWQSDAKHYRVDPDEAYCKYCGCTVDEKGRGKHDPKCKTLGKTKGA